MRDQGQQNATMHDAATPAGSGLELVGLAKRFGAFEAVAEVDLDICRGEFLTLLGPSGSGKTTLLMMIAGFQTPSAGEIRLDGRDISPLPPERRNFGMMFQGYALFPHMTVRQNIAYPLEVRRRPRPEIAARVDEMLALVQLEAFADRRPRQLSGGQQQRVALARALSFGPSVLLLDEPLGALDKKLRSDVQAQLKDLHRQMGVTFIYVTHDQEEALSLSDRIAILDKGRLVQVGAPDALYERPASLFAADFLGKSNFIAVRAAALGEDAVICAASGKRYAQSGARDASAAAMTLAIRPEKISIDAAPADDPARNSLEGRVRRRTYFGATAEIEVETADVGAVVVHRAAWPATPAHEVGRRVWISWGAEAGVLLPSAPTGG